LQYLFRDFECVTLQHRNGYLDAVYVLCLRLFNIGAERQNLRLGWRPGILSRATGVLAIGSLVDQRRRHDGLLLRLPQASLGTDTGE